jgi:hypothetical protein
LLLPLLLQRPGWLPGGLQVTGALWESRQAGAAAAAAAAAGNAEHLQVRQAVRVLALQPLLPLQLTQLA